MGLIAMYQRYDKNYPLELADRLPEHVHIAATPAGLCDSVKENPVCRSTEVDATLVRDWTTTMELLTNADTLNQSNPTKNPKGPSSDQLLARRGFRMLCGT